MKELKKTRSAGGVVLGDGDMVALVFSHNSQSWLFPKGKVDLGETDEDAARREIREEAGLTDLEYLDDLGEYTRPRIQFEKTGYDEKTIKMFLFAAPKGAMLAPSMEIEDAKWVPYRAVAAELGTPHIDWFGADRAWFASIFPRIQEAIRRD